MVWRLKMRLVIAISHGMKGLTAYGLVDAEKLVALGFEPYCKHLNLIVFKFRFMVAPW